MKRAQRAAVSVAALPLIAATAAVAASAQASCELVLAEHRSGRELARLPLDAVRPGMQIAFTHSVLGTPVSDRYLWRAHEGQWRAHLVEERFEGQGYGLPNAAGPGETLVREGAGWRLQLDRLVHPLVVLPLPSQEMRVQIGAAPALLLGSLSAASIEMRVHACAVN